MATTRSASATAASVSWRLRWAGAFEAEGPQRRTGPDADGLVLDDVGARGRGAHGDAAVPRASLPAMTERAALPVHRNRT